MKQEEIAKQADEYSRQRVRENERYKAMFTRSEIAKAFKDGTDWRINSVWHDMKAEEPQAFGEYADKVYPQVPCLVNGLLSTGYGYGVRYWNVTEKCWGDEECDDFECAKEAIEKWAYLDDLLPQEKGETK